MSDQHKPLTAGEIEELRELEAKATPGPWEVGETDKYGQQTVGDKFITLLSCWHHSVESLEEESIANASLIAVMRNALPRLLYMLTPPTDAAVKEAVEFSAEARCSRLAHGILRIGKKLRVMRADMASQTDALIAAMYAINDAGILMPDEVLDYASGVRAVQAPRLTREQVEAAFREGYELGNDDGRNIDVFCHIKQHNPESNPDFAWEHSNTRRAAFPEAFAGEVVK